MHASSCSLPDHYITDARRTCPAQQLRSLKTFRMDGTAERIKTFYFTYFYFTYVKLRTGPCTISYIVPVNMAQTYDWNGAATTCICQWVVDGHNVQCFITRPMSVHQQQQLVRHRWPTRQADLPSCNFNLDCVLRFNFLDHDIWQAGFFNIVIVRDLTHPPCLKFSTTCYCVHR